MSKAVSKDLNLGLSICLDLGFKMHLSISFHYTIERRCCLALFAAVIIRTLTRPL